MKNIKYSIDILIRRPLFLVLILIQFSMTIVFFNLSVTGIVTSKQTAERIGEIFNDVQLYGIQDKTNEELLFEEIFKKPDAKFKLKEFHDFLVNNNDFEFIEYESSNIAIKGPNLDENFLYSIEHPFVNTELGRLNLLKSIEVGANFFDHFPFEIDEGKKFNKLDFSNGSIRTVILGSKFKDHYGIGDKINYYDYEVKELKELEIKGFLKDDYYFLDRGQGLIALDHYMILPKQPIDMDSDVAISKLDASINQSIIITENPETTFNLIQEKSRNLGLYNALKKFDLNNQCKLLSDVLHTNINKILPIGVAIFLFSVLSIIVSLLGIIRKNKKEFGVHLLSGATIKDLSLRVLYITFFYIAISSILATIISNRIKNMIFPEIFSINIYGYTLILGILITLIIAIFPIKELHKTEIQDIIKGKE